MGRILFSLCALFFLVTLTHCTNKKPSSKEVVFKVNGHTLSRSEFAQSFADKLKFFDAVAVKNPTIQASVQNQILRNFLIYALVSEEAEKNNVTVTKAELEKEVALERSHFPNDLAFQTVLKSEMLTQDEWVKKIRMRLLHKKFFSSITKQPVITDAMVRTYYEAHRSEFSLPAQVKIQQILVGKLEEAELLKHDLLKSNDFATVAKKYSQSPEATRGGLVGWIGEGLNPAFDQAFKMRPGQVSSVIKTSYGYHIVKLVDRRPASTKPLSQVQSYIRVQLQSEAQEKAFRDWLEGVIPKAHVEKNEEFFKNLKVSTEEGLGS